MYLHTYLLSYLFNQTFECTQHRRHTHLRHTMNIIHTDFANKHLSRCTVETIASHLLLLQKLQKKIEKVTIINSFDKMSNKKELNHAPVGSFESAQCRL